MVYRNIVVTLFSKLWSVSYLSACVWNSELPQIWFVRSIQFIRSCLQVGLIVLSLSFLRILWAAAFDQDVVYGYKIIVHCQHCVHLACSEPDDDVASVVQNDLSIIQFAKSLYNKCGTCDRTSVKLVIFCYICAQNSLCITLRRLLNLLGSRKLCKQKKVSGSG